jgi:hypothetical protein
MKKKIIIRNNQLKILVKACQFIFYFLDYSKYMLNTFFPKFSILL